MKKTLVCILSFCSMWPAMATAKSPLDPWDVTQSLGQEMISSREAVLTDIFELQRQIEELKSSRVLNEVAAGVAFVLILGSVNGVLHNGGLWGVPRRLWATLGGLSTITTGYNTVKIYVNSEEIDRLQDSLEIEANYLKKELRSLDILLNSPGEAVLQPQ